MVVCWSVHTWFGAQVILFDGRKWSGDRQNDMLCCVKGVKIQHQAVPYVMPDMSLQKQWGVSMATCKLAMNSLPTFNPDLLPCCHMLPSDLVRLYQLHCQVFSPEELCGHLASRWRFDNIGLGDVPKACPGRAFKRKESSHGWWPWMRATVLISTYSQVHSYL